METIQYKQLTPEFEGVFRKNILDLLAWQYPDDDPFVYPIIADSRVRRYKMGMWNWKSCKRCGRFEGPVEFGAHARARDGKQSICKICSIEMGKNIYKKQHDGSPSRNWSPDADGDL